MKQLLSIEFAKLRKLNSIKIILLVYMILVPLFMYVVSEFWHHMMFPVIKISQGPNWHYPKIWEFAEVMKFTFYCASYFHILIGVILVIIISNEFSFRTAKQNVIDGLTKKQLIFGKLLILFILSLFITLYNTLCAITFGLINSSAIDLYTNSHYIFVFFFQSFCYFSLAIFFVILIRHAALSVLVFVIFPVVDIVAGQIVPNIFYTFFPLNIFATLTPSSIRREFIAIDEKQNKTEILDLNLWQLIVISLGFIAVFYAVSYLIIKRRDL